jgi:hypothetical protein
VFHGKRSTIPKRNISTRMSAETNLPAMPYSAPISVIVFLCFTGFRRLSGIVRSVGGIPRPRRASRRASL